MRLVGERVEKVDVECDSDEKRDDCGGIDSAPEIIAATRARLVNGADVDPSATENVVICDLDAAERREANSDERENGAKLVEHELRHEYAEERDRHDRHEQHDNPRKLLESAEVSQPDRGGVYSCDRRAEVCRGHERKCGDGIEVPTDVA